MEKITEFMEHVKERFANPLFFSFLLSWLVINWPITIALIWFDASQIEAEGYRSIFQFITAKTNPSSSLTLPVIFAIGYTILSPILKNLVRAFYSWASKWGDLWNFRILQGGQISVNKYLRLRSDYDIRTKILEEVITKESEYRETYDSMNTQLLEGRANLNDVSEKLMQAQETVAKMRDSSVLNGYWENRYTENDVAGVEKIYIDNGRYSRISSNGRKDLEFDIRDFLYDPRNGNVFFVKEVVTEKKSTRAVQEHYNINRLQFENGDLLVGIENGTTNIVYSRIKDRIQ